MPGYGVWLVVLEEFKLLTTLFRNAFKPNVIKYMCQNVIAWLRRDILGIPTHDSRISDRYVSAGGGQIVTPYPFLHKPGGIKKKILSSRKPPSTPSKRETGWIARSSIIDRQWKKPSTCIYHMHLLLGPTSTYACLQRLSKTSWRGRTGEQGRSYGQHERFEQKKGQKPVCYCTFGSRSTYTKQTTTSHPCLTSTCSIQRHNL